MAKFDTTELENLTLDMEELAKISDDMIDRMLDAGAKVIAAGHEKTLRGMGLVRTGKLASSIKSVRKASGNKRYALIYPNGPHHTYKGRKGGRKTARNADVGFVHEFGARKRGIAASQWMRVANERHIDEAVDAEMRVYDEYLKRHNL